MTSAIGPVSLRFVVSVVIPPQKKRARVCGACVYLTDDVLGYVHSELACTRCSAKPCSGCIVEFIVRKQEAIATEE